MCLGMGVYPKMFFFCVFQGSLIHQLRVYSPTNLVKAGLLTMTHTLLPLISHNFLIRLWKCEQMNFVATIHSVCLT